MINSSLLLDIPSAKEYWPVHYLDLYFLPATFLFSFFVLVFLILCDEPTLSPSRGHRTVPRENYTLLRYHLAMLGIDDLYNYAQSNRSNPVFLQFVGVYLLSSFFILAR